MNTDTETLFAEVHETELGPASAWTSLTNAEFGAFGEALVRNFLLARGFRLIAENTRKRPYAQVDLIMAKDEIHYFFEVKAERGSRFAADPSGVLTPRQYARLYNAAELYAGQRDISVRICLALLSIQSEEGRTRGAISIQPIV